MNDDQPTTPDLQFAGGGLFVKSLYAGQVALNEYHAATQRKSLTCADTITLMQVFADGLSAKNQPCAVIL